MKLDDKNISQSNTNTKIVQFNSHTISPWSAETNKTRGRLPVNFIQENDFQGTFDLNSSKQSKTNKKTKFVLSECLQYAVTAQSFHKAVQKPLKSQEITRQTPLQQLVNDKNKNNIEFSSSKFGLQRENLSQDRQYALKPKTVRLTPPYQLFSVENQFDIETLYKTLGLSPGYLKKFSKSSQNPRNIKESLAQQFLSPMNKSNIESLSRTIGLSPRYLSQDPNSALKRETRKEPQPSLLYGTKNYLQNKSLSRARLPHGQMQMNKLRNLKPKIKLDTVKVFLEEKKLDTKSLPKKVCLSPRYLLLPQTPDRCVSLQETIGNRSSHYKRSREKALRQIVRIPRQKKVNYKDHSFFSQQTPVLKLCSLQEYKYSNRASDHTIHLIDTIVYEPIIIQ